MDRERSGEEEPWWLVRTLEWFEKEPGAKLIGECDLETVQLAELQSRWNLSATDPMLNMYPVSESQRPYVQMHTDHVIRLDDYDYFIGCITKDWYAAQRDGGYMGLMPPPRNLPLPPK